MRKRILAVIMVLALVIAMAPAAFAVEECGRGNPTESLVVSVSDAAAVPMPMSDIPGVGGEGTEADPYEINSVEGFVALASMFNSYIGERFIELNVDLNLGPYAQLWTEWGGLFTYLHGSIDGNGHTISGVPDNCHLIYQWHDGTIKDLTFELDGNAATLVYASFSLRASDGTINRGVTTMENIEVTSNEPVVLTSNDQANYAPFVFSCGPYFTMSGCKNYADISGNTYASVFYGYYPLPLNDYPADASIQILNCENHGNVSLRYAGLVFGNPFGMVSDRNVTITGLKNYGQIRGTDTAHYFCSDAGNASWYSNEDGYFAQMEESLVSSGNMTPTCNESDCPNVGSVGSLCVGEDLEGFGLTLNENGTFTIVEPTNADDVEKYVVTAYAYVHIFWANTHLREGTTRIAISDTLTGANLTTSTVRNYPLKDGQRPEEVTDLNPDRGLYVVIGEESYYWLDNSATIEVNYNAFINSDRTPGSTNMTIYASAYDENGMLLDTIQYVG